MAIEEGLETTGKRVTINNFFESIQDIDEIANNAIKSVTDQGSIVDGLVKAIEEIKLEIKEIKAYIMVQEDEEKDRLLEAQDAEQKREMTERALSLQGVDSSDQRTAGSPEDQGVSFAENAQQKNVTNPQEQKGFFGSLAGLFGSSLLQLPAALLGAGSNNLNLVQNLNKGGKVNDTDNDKTNNDEDSVPAMLTPGEFVITKDAVEKVGVDTLKGINAAAGGTNEPKPLGTAEDLGSFSIGRLDPNAIGNNALIERRSQTSDKKEVEISNKSGTDYFKTTTDMSGSGVDEETVRREKITEDDGSVLTTEERLRERIVSVGVPDLIEHKTQLLGEIHKLKGFEKITIDDVINGTTGIPDDKLFEIVNQSDAAKATEKKQEEAREEDFKARNIKPGKGFTISAEDEVAKSLAGTIGYRVGQINPDQKVIAFDQLTTRTKEVFKSEEDPKFKEAHANAKKSGGVKGYSEGGLVGEDIKGNKTNPMDIFSGITKSLEDLTKSPLANEMKNIVDNDKLGLENIANKASEIIGGKEGLNDFKDNIIGTVKKRLLGGEESSNLLQKIESAFDKIEGIIPTEDDMEELTQSDGPPSVKLPSSSGNKGALVQKDRANVAEVEIKQAISDIAFVNLARLQSGEFNNIKNINESDLPASVRNLLKIK